MRKPGLWCFALLVFSAVLSLEATDLASTDAISATATVVYPVGLYELRDASEQQGIPLLKAIGSRSFLFIPRGHPLLILDGVPIEAETSPRDEVITMLDLTELVSERASGKPILLSIIFTDN